MVVTGGGPIPGTVVVEELVVEVDEVDEVVVGGVVVVASVVVVVLVDVGAPVVVVTATQSSGKVTGPAVAVSPDHGVGQRQRRCRLLAGPRDGDGGVGLEDQRPVRGAVAEVEHAGLTVEVGAVAERDRDAGR